MAVAQPRAGQAAADAAALLADGAAEAGAAADQRVCLALQCRQRRFEQRTQLDDARQIFLGADLAFDAAAREHLDILCQRAQLFGAELARLALQRSEARRVGKECVSKCRSRWSPCP